jgi:SAM-dependent methyltransferase
MCQNSGTSQRADRNGMIGQLRRMASRVARSRHRIEVDHWADVERRAKSGERQFWLNHPRVNHHYHRKSLIDGLYWQGWVRRHLGGPVAVGLELGCGNGAALAHMVESGFITRGVGLDLEESRFTAGRPDGRIGFIGADVNTIALEPGAYDLVYALQAFHHFEAIEHVMAQVHTALKPNGVFVLDEFVGPSRFQWTDEQLAWTGHLLDLMPRELRKYPNGVEKRREGRSTPEEVIRVCPSEAIRPGDIPTVFASTFRPVAKKNLGGTIQHLLYSGIIQNFPDNDPDVDAIIDSVDAIETSLIDQGILPSDFMLLLGTRRD